MFVRIFIRHKHVCRGIYFTQKTYFVEVGSYVATNEIIFIVYLSCYILPCIIPLFSAFNIDFILLFLFNQGINKLVFEMIPNDIFTFKKSGFCHLTNMQLIT